MKTRAMRHFLVGLIRTRRSFPPVALVFAVLVIALAGCAQNREQSEPVQASEDEHLANGLRSYNRGAPLNNREIPEGPGIFTGREGSFVIFRK